MPTRKQASVRKPRSDAQRNRERILEVAKETFTRSGANTSLDDIASDAGVGPGTLYRHFPSRGTRVYLRPDCDALSYPTWTAPVSRLALLAISKRRASRKRNCF